MSSYLRCLFLIITLHFCKVSAIPCVSCVYDEAVSYSVNRSCLTNPAVMPITECEHGYCLTAAGYYGVANKLRVYRGCNDSATYDWTDGCKFFKFNTVIDGYVCICDGNNTCNSDDTGYRSCYQCDSRQDSDCLAGLSNSGPYPCLTGHTGCVSDTMEPYPHHGSTYTGSDLYDYVRRYCSNEDFGSEGLFADFHHASLHCQLSCTSNGCNNVNDECITVKTIQCTECYYDGDITDDSNLDCLINPQSVPTTECYSQCFTKAWYTETGPLQVVRGCDRQLTYDWNNLCQVIGGKYRICTCDHEDLCNADDTDYSRCYQCDSRHDANCADRYVHTLEVLPCLTGARGCVTQTMTSYEAQEAIIGDSENFNFVRRYCSDDYQAPGFYCSDYLGVAQQCFHSCSEDGCTHRLDDCQSRENITDPITCISCEYNSEAPGSHKDCLTDPYAMGTVRCNSKCVTYGYSDMGKLWIYRGCDCNDEYYWEDSCRYIKVGNSDHAYICTCGDETFCNADDNDRHLCYQCDSRKDGDCYSDLTKNSPSPCLSGHRGCVTETMIPYEEFTVGRGSSSYNYVQRYCSEENYGPDGNCLDYLGASLLCYYSCNSDGCNNISGSRLKTEYSVYCLMFAFTVYLWSFEV